MAAEDICRICGEPESAHVPTGDGPLTHPKQAAGLGIYRLVNRGTSYHGLACLDCSGGPCDGHPWETWEFVPKDSTAETFS